VFSRAWWQHPHRNAQFPLEISQARGEHGYGLFPDRCARNRYSLLAHGHLRPWRGVGSGSFSIKVEGKIGRIPRFVFLIFSGINYIAALVLFMAIIGNSSSSTPTGNTVQQPGPAQVTIDIADQLTGNEYAENVTVNIQGAAAVTLAANGNNSDPDQTITLAEGQHAYQITVQGVTTSDQSYDYAGQGTIIAEQGNSYSVVYDPSTSAVGLQPG
jgi:hypothetical protein